MKRCSCTGNRSCHNTSNVSAQRKQSVPSPPLSCAPISKSVRFTPVSNAKQLSIANSHLRTGGRGGSTHRCRSRLPLAPGLFSAFRSFVYKQGGQKLYLQQPVGRRRNSCSFNCFNPQYLRRPNSYQQKQISVPISNYTCSNQLVDIETVVRSTASIHNICVDQRVTNKKRSVF